MLTARPLASNKEGIAFDCIARSSGSIFHKPSWVCHFENNLKRIGIFNDQEQLVGGFHLFQESRFGLRILRDPPNTPDCGPFWISRAEHPVAKLDEARGVITAMAEYLRTSNAALIYVSLSQQVCDTMPFIWSKFRVIPRYTYLLPLKQSMEHIRSGLSASLRNNMVKAKKDGLCFRLVDSGEYQLIENLVLKTFSRQGKDPKAVYLRKILSAAYDGEIKAYAFVTYRGTVPIASVFVIHDNKRAVNILAGYDPTLKHSGAGALAMYAALEHARECGLQVFDFEGSMLPPVERYYRKFGAQLYPYFTVNRGWYLLECMLKIKMRQLF